MIEYEIIGVCFIANDVTTDENNGIYKKSQIGIDSTNLKKSDFENLNFSPDIEQMKNYINIEKNYIVFCPNTKTWDLTKKRVSGFNEDKNFLGQPQIAETGAYYSNGYIRLIYIVENN